MTCPADPPPCVGRRPRGNRPLPKGWEQADWSGAEQATACSFLGIKTLRGRYLILGFLHSQATLASRPMSSPLFDSPSFIRAFSLDCNK